MIFENQDERTRTKPSVVVAHAKLKEGKDGGALLESVVVAEQLRGKGLGRELLSEVERRAMLMGVRELWLTTEGQQRFYGGAGYACRPDPPGWAVKGGGRGREPPEGLARAQGGGTWMHKSMHTPEGRGERGGAEREEKTEVEGREG